MTPTDIQSALDALVWVEFDIDDPAYDWVADACIKARAVIEDLRKDRERLEWLINQECFLSRLPDGSCYVADVAGICEHPQRSTAREAIDEAMTHGDQRQ